MSTSEILNNISKHDCNLLEITGGEPLLQDELYSLVEELLKNNYQILMETNGSQNIHQLPKEVIKILDWKTPGSGEENSFNTDNLNYISEKDEIKFVLSDACDYEWSKKQIIDNNLTARCKILMSVVKDKFDPAELCELILKDNLDVRFQLQLHKYIWPKDEKGR